MTWDRLQRGPAHADRRLVLLHGWGADADDLLELGALLAGPEVNLVALRAPLPHPAGVGRQWYDLEQPGWPQLPAAREDLRRRLRELDRDPPLTRTVLLGFSQGAALALDVTTGDGGGGDGGGGDGGGLPLAGVIGCSGYPHPDWRPRAAGRHPGEGRTPVLLTHGQQDPVVPFAASERLQSQLRARGWEAALIGFSGGHTIDAALVPRLLEFVQACWRRPGAEADPVR